MGRRAVRQTDPDNRQYVNFASSGYVQSTAEIRKYFNFLRLLYTFIINYAVTSILLIQLRLVGVNRCQQWVVSHSCIRAYKYTCRNSIIIY